MMIKSHGTALSSPQNVTPTPGNTVKHKGCRVEVPLFPLAVTALRVKHLQILECKKDLLQKVNYMISVTK
jgi:hypothetical protein